MFPTNEISQMEGDEATVTEPSDLLTEEAMVPVDVTVDPSAIPVPQVEDVVEEVPILIANARIQVEQPYLLAIDAEEIVDESPSHDFQQVMEGEVETGEVHPTSPIKNLVGGVPNTTEIVLAEGITLLFFHLSFSLFFLQHLFTFSLTGTQNINIQVAEGPHPDEPPSSRKRLDEVITSQRSGSIDIKTSVDRFLEGPHHDFDEVIRMFFKFYLHIWLFCHFDLQSFH